MLPRGPGSVVGRSWDSRGLVLFLKEGGAVVEYTDDEGRPTSVVPHVELWVESGSSRPVSSHEGRAVEIPRPGQFSFDRIISGVFDDLARAMEKFLPGDQFVVTSVKTLEHKQGLTWSDREATAALTFRFMPASDGSSKIKNHMLVLFIQPGEDPR